MEETENLIALHNLTEENCGRPSAGRLPHAPSLLPGLTCPTLISETLRWSVDKRSIDPKANRKNTVYPPTHGRRPSAGGVRRRSGGRAPHFGRLRELSGKVDEMFRQDLYRITHDMEDLLNRCMAEDGLLRQVMDNYGLAAYLEDAGHHVSAATVQREADKGVQPGPGRKVPGNRRSPLGRMTRTRSVISR